MLSFDPWWLVLATGTSGSVTAPHLHRERVMPERDRHGERELASFIRSGAERRPDQAFGDYYRGKQASCALGAAYEGMYRLPREATGLHPTKDLDWFFDCLEGTVRQCPGEGCKKKLVLAAIIVHLNDDHRWSREQIATWLESVNGKRT